LNNLLEYKGYMGNVEYSSTDKLLHGKVLGIRSLIMYHGTSLDELEADFRTGVDDYLAVCEAEGINPNLPNYGTIEIKGISPDVHLRLLNLSETKSKPFNETVEEAFIAYLMLQNRESMLV